MSEDEDEFDDEEDGVGFQATEDEEDSEFGEEDLA